jgi:hypothetical protein
MNGERGTPRGRPPLDSGLQSAQVTTSGDATELRLQVIRSCERTSSGGIRLGAAAGTVYYNTAPLPLLFLQLVYIAVVGIPVAVESGEDFPPNPMDFRDDWIFSHITP